MKLFTQGHILKETVINSEWETSSSYFATRVLPASIMPTDWEVWIAHGCEYAFIEFYSSLPSGQSRRH